MKAAGKLYLCGYLLVVLAAIRLAKGSSRRSGIEQNARDPDLLKLWCKSDQDGKDYVGFAYKTISGRTCQSFSDQYPHEHERSVGEGDFPEHSLPDHHLAKISLSNFCRNPDEEKVGPWCYTVDRNRRWEICPVPYCERCESFFLYKTARVGGCIWDGVHGRSFRNFQCGTKSGRLVPCSQSYQALKIRIMSTWGKSAELRCPYYTGAFIIRIIFAYLTEFTKGLDTDVMESDYGHSVLVDSMASRCDNHHKCVYSFVNDVGHELIYEYMCVPKFTGRINIDNCPLRSCIFPFKYLGKTYDRCAKLRNGRSFCSATENFDLDQDYCFCDEDIINLVGEEVAVENCVGDCKKKKGDSRPWCSLTSNFEEDLLWKWCD